MFGQGLAQGLLQMPRVQYDLEHEDVQGLREAALL